MILNLKLRFKNKTTFAAIVACVVAFIYQMLGFAGIVAPVSEDMVMQFIGAGINILAVLGVLVDPTTAGIGDSQRALGYNEPAK